MARGGFRAGAGRPKRGSKPMVAKDLPAEIKQVYIAASGDLKITPLEFLINAMNDSNLDFIDRMRAAAIAAPFVHAKAGEKGKKDERKDAAEKAASGKFATPMAPKLAIV